ncbi:DUF6049 family protein [uncultured Microbacterium sp.]|uniref:Pyruvate/2-oxoglutarate dehydrogenase complex, dihydrolipoamide acyltransferase (E2) component n=1 Tax=uncultured Microbacterium sp. TaxID=191216 RepID=A0A1Y5P9H4_9MICO|nr:DUF6049 family protein [uncultured Microbacterium sp.]SBS72771.1 Pyruvate/2-oxoglutarate dehydrogenase complex, dihydrolipoamide acyltransferase (E2) component [uncultured Microbacterium sp.]
MTMTSPSPGPRAARPRRAPRAPRVRLAAAVAAILALVLTPVAAVAAGPPPSRPLTFAMAPRGDGIPVDGQSLIVSLTAGNPTDSTVAAGDVTIAIGRDALRTRTSLDAWLGGDRPSLRLTPIATTRIDALAAHGVRTTTSAIEPADSGIDDLAPGVYPLLATYSSAQGDLTSASVVTIPDEDAAAADVAVVVPITAGGLSDGLLTAEQLSELTADGGTLRDQLDAVAGTAAILAVDPALPAAIRVLGQSAPPSAVTWLDDLLAFPNPRFALQFGDADLAAQVAAGLSRPLSPLPLTSYLDPANFTESDAETPEPSPTPGGDPSLPDLEELTDLGTSAGTILWPATGTAGAETVAALGEVVVDDAASVTLVSSDATTATGAVPARAAAGDAQLLVYDAAVSAALRTAAAAEDAVPRAAAQAAAVAYAQTAGRENPGATLLVTVDRGVDRSRAALHDAVTTATDLPGRAPVTLREVLDDAPAAVELRSVEPDVARVAALRAFQDDETELTAFATILEDATLLTGSERAAVLQLLGNGWRGELEQWGDAVAEHRAQSRATLGAVAIVPAGDKTLLGSAAPMRFSIRNDLRWPVSLVLIASPNDPRLVVQRTTPVEAEAAQNTRAEVPVEARVGSGESTIDLQLRSPSMVAIGGPVSVGVNVQAEWESVGVIVMGVLVVGLLVLGVIRTVRRMRRRRETPGASPAVTPGEETPEVADV